eukprot:472178-Prymnesium_polylepis.2
MWSMRRAMLQKEGRKGSAEMAGLQTSSDLLVGEALQLAMRVSPIVSKGLAGQAGFVAVRYLSHIKRGPLSLAKQDWVLVVGGGDPFIGQLSDMAVFCINGRTYVGLWCSSCYRPKEDDTGCLLVSKSAGIGSALIDLDSVSLTLLCKSLRETPAGELSFRCLL